MDPKHISNCKSNSVLGKGKLIFSSIQANPWYIGLLFFVISLSKESDWFYIGLHN